jgi:hypothetical protein
MNINDGIKSHQKPNSVRGLKSHQKPNSESIPCKAGKLMTEYMEKAE